MLFGPGTMSPSKSVSVDMWEGRMATLWRSLSLLSNRMVNVWPSGTARQSLSNLWPSAVMASDVPAGEHVAPMSIAGDTPEPPGRSAADATPPPGAPAASIAATAAAPSHFPMVSLPSSGERDPLGPDEQSVSAG